MERIIMLVGDGVIKATTTRDVGLRDGIVVKKRVGGGWCRGRVHSCLWVKYSTVGMFAAGSDCRIWVVAGEAGCRQVHLGP